MKKNFLKLFGMIVGFSILCCIGNCQTTTVSGTIVDPDTTVWTTAVVTLQFAPNPNQPNIGIYNINGVPLDSHQLTKTATTDGSGHFAITGVYDNLQISPSGSTWSITIAPNVSVLPSQFTQLVITGLSQDLTTFIDSNIQAPRLPALIVAGLMNRAYNDGEIKPIPVPGGQYYNVSSSSCRQWNGTVFANCGSGATSTPFPPAFSVQAANSTVTGPVSDSNIQINTGLHQQVSKLPIVNILHTDFGSPSGCGNISDPSNSVDSTCAALAAITFAGSVSSFGNSKATVYVPLGTYLISAPLVIPSNVRLMGDASASSIFNFTNSTAIDAGISISNASNVQVDHIGIQCSTSPTTCTRGIKVSVGQHIKLLYNNITGAGAGASANPRADIFVHASDDVEIGYNTISNSSGEYEIINNAFGFGPVSTRLFIHDNVLDNNTAIIGIADFDCQYCRHINNTINENNQTDDTIHDGYGELFYWTTLQTYTLAGLTGSGTITATVNFVSGVTVLPPVGVKVYITIAGVTGGTGTLNGGFEGTVQSSTTVSYTCSGCNAAGSSISGATLIEKPAYNHSIGNNIHNTAGSGLYFQTCNYCTSTGDIFSNVVLQEVATSLPAAAIAVNGGLGVSITGPVINGSPQSGIEFANTDSLSISGGSINNVVTGILIRVTNTNFSVGGDVALSGTNTCIREANNGSVGQINGFACENFSSLGVSDAAATNTNLTVRNGIFKNTSNVVPAVFDVQTGTVLSDLKADGAYFDLRGNSYKGDALEVDNLPSLSNFAFIVRGSHVQLSNLKTLSVANAVSIQSLGGVQPSDIDIDAKFIGLSGTALQDPAPLALTGNTTSGSNVISSLSTTSGLFAGMIIDDLTGSGFIPPASVIQSVNSGTGCSSACVVINNNATNTSPVGENIEVYTTVASNIKWHVDAQGNYPTTSQCILSNAFQSLTIKGGNCDGFDTTADNVVDFRNATNTVEVALMNVSSGMNGLRVSQNASNIFVHDTTIQGAHQAGLIDTTSNLGNVYIRNTLTGNGTVTQTNVTNVNAVMYGNIVGFGQSPPGGTLCVTSAIWNEFLQSSSSGRIRWTCGPGAVWSSTNSGAQLISGTFTTTSATSESVTLNGCTTTSHISVQATNSTAAALTGVFISSPVANGFTLNHSATSGGTFNTFCTPN